MPIKPATYSDLLPAAKLLARAFRDEPLFGDYMHPHRDKYPDDIYLHFLRKLRGIYVSGPDDLTFVSYKEGPDGQDEITGIAVWHRYRAKSSTSMYNASMKRMMALYNYIESFVYPNRAADASREDVFVRTGPYVAHHWTGTRAECWGLELLAVDPDQEGQGFGRELVTWGFEKARGEGVGCSVVSSSGKERFYERCGFDVVAGKVCDEGGEANPLRAIPGGTIHFWDNGRGVESVKKYEEMPHVVQARLSRECSSS